MYKTMSKLHLAKNALLKKQFIVLYILISLMIAFVTTGAVLIGVGYQTYLDFVGIWIKTYQMNPKATTAQGAPNITLFIYGIFFLILGAILVFAVIMYAYNVKKQLQKIAAQKIDLNGAKKDNLAN